jgi:hypothetical protein
MAYAIVRITKIKKANTAKIRKMLKHNLRVEETPGDNINIKNSFLNEVLIGADTVDGIDEDFKNRWAELEELNTDKNGRKTKFRSDAVGLVEIMLTASPEFFQTATKAQIDEWLKEQKQFLIDEYNLENVKSLIVHRDETTIHLHANIIPVFNGKLNAKLLFGGRKKLSDFQTRYAKRQARFGLERGKCRVIDKPENPEDYPQPVRHKELWENRRDIKEIVVEASKSGVDMKDPFTIVNNAIKAPKLEKIVNTYKEFVDTTLGLVDSFKSFVARKKANPSIVDYSKENRVKLLETRYGKKDDMKPK